MEAVFVISAVERRVDSKLYKMFSAYDDLFLIVVIEKHKIIIINLNVCLFLKKVCFFLKKKKDFKLTDYMRSV